jgi:hypothetical protein
MKITDTLHEDPNSVLKVARSVSSLDDGTLELPWEGSHGHLTSVFNSCITMISILTSRVFTVC